MNNLVLVTGGTGYIGSHTVVELLENNYNVLIVDNLNNSRKEVLDGVTQITGKQVHFEKIDICDKEAFFAVLAKYPNIKSVIHFAAHKAVGESVENPLKYYHNNITGTLHVLQAMEMFHIKNLVFSSSCTVYGQPDILPVTELSPMKPAASPYGFTKQVSEQMIKDYMQVSKNLNSISLRYFNPVGAHPSTLIGELPTGVPDNLIPYVTQTASGLRDHLRVFGSDYNTPDGTPLRDYIDITDLAKAHLAAINRMEANQMESNYEFYNIGTGTGRSVLEIIAAFEQATGIKINYKIYPRREGDVEKVWADTRMANEKLKWKASRLLTETLASTWAWQLHYNNTGVK